jgi:hypothetical protein
LGKWSVEFCVLFIVGGLVGCLGTDSQWIVETWTSDGELYAAEFFATCHFEIEDEKETK